MRERGGGQHSCDPRRSMMTTQRQMAMAYTAQAEVIIALRMIGEIDLAIRLELCMNTRLERHHGDGWPHICRSAACVWCRRSLIRGWWNGMCHWSAEAATSSLAIMRIDSPVGLHDAVRRLRRGLRDVRDRMARRRRLWREVGFAGMAGGDRRALVLVSHDGVDRREVWMCWMCCAHGGPMSWSRVWNKRRRGRTWWPKMPPILAVAAGVSNHCGS